MDAGLPSGTVTFLCSDIEGSTELSRRHGAAYGDLRAEHRRVLREVFQQELQVGRETPRAVPAEAVVKESSATRTQEGEDVLEVGCGTRRCTKRRRIEWASPRGEEKDASDAARHLKATRAEVLVR